MHLQQPNVVRCTHIDCETAFSKEAELIEAIKSGACNQALMLWQCASPTVVFPAGKKWVLSDPLNAYLDDLGWQITHRRTGGSPVPQKSGIINVAHMYIWPDHTSYSVKPAYQAFCAALSVFFNKLNISVDIHATPFSYCDGDFNLNINGQKVVGTAQRVISLGQQRKLVLAHACIIVDEDLEKLILPINKCNEFNAVEDRIKAEAHTCISAHVNPLPPIETLYDTLAEAFS